MLRNLVLRFLVDIRCDTAFKTHAHDLGARSGLDDFLEPVLELNRHFLGIFVGLGRERHEHALLHGDIAFRIFFLGVPAAHRAVAELPRGRDLASIFQRDRLYSRGEQSLLDLADLNHPALFRGGRSRPGRLLGGDLLSGAELVQLAGVGQQPVEQADTARRQEEPADVDHPVLPRGQSHEDEETSDWQEDRSEPLAPDRRRCRDR